MEKDSVSCGLKSTLSLTGFSFNSPSIGGESGVIFELHRACKRCSVTAFNPDTAVPDAGAQTLAALRTLRAAHCDSGEAVGLFGQYAIHQNNGEILVNQAIEVLQYKRQNDQKHPLITPFKLQPHALHSNFKPFRVVRISCDDSTNPRPTCRLELEVERRLHRHLVLLLCPHFLLQVDSSASALPVGSHIKVCFLFYSPRT